VLAERSSRVRALLDRDPDYGHRPQVCPSDRNPYYDCIGQHPVYARITAVFTGRRRASAFKKPRSGGSGATFVRPGLHDQCVLSSLSASDLLLPYARCR
jgi:hypothetical protein